MRKLLAATLAVPVLALLYLGSAIRRSPFGSSGRRPRFIAAVAAISLIALVVAAQSRPAATVARPETPITPLADTAFTSEVHAGTSPTERVTISFAAPMDPASVLASLRVDPADPVTLAWDPAGTVLTVTPVGSWKTGRYHTITVPSGTLEASGTPIGTSVRVSFLTRDATIATITATDVDGATVRTATRFRIAFDHPIDDSTIDLATSPTISGSLEPDPSTTIDAPAFFFVPFDPLEPNTTYTVSLTPGAVDAESQAVSSMPLTVSTASAPGIVRFRPRQGSTGVDRTQALSVRFSRPMDRPSTQAAWTVTAGGTPVAGTFTWTQNDTVLVFTPKAAFGYSQKIVMSVAGTAQSKAGVALSSATSASFTTVPKPVTRRPPSTRTSGGGSGSGSGGGSVGAGTWAAVESYYLKLMNCTRTGGWVTSTGSCSSPGGRNVAALWQDAGISTKVSRPYAKKLAVNNLCTHYSGGTPADRLRLAGYTSYVWGENLGCRSGDPYAAVLGSHLFFQSEKSYNGGHYRNLMDPDFDRCGIGVWVSSGRVRLVVDFYHPL